MAEYALYLESGPQHRTTMAHVIHLLGCVVQGRSSDEAVEAAPQAIRAYLDFLGRHGEAIDAADSIETAIAQHVIERGGMTGGGNPTAGFTTDFEPLSRERLHTLIRWYGWLHEEMVTLVRTSRPELEDLLPGGKWQFRRLLEHVAEAEYEYVRCSLGHIDGLRHEFRALQRDAGDPLSALECVHAAISARLEALTDDELGVVTQRGARTWTVARTMRRILEHRWEHYQQLTNALGG